MFIVHNVQQRIQIQLLEVHFPHVEGGLESLNRGLGAPCHPEALLLAP